MNKLPTWSKSLPRKVTISGRCVSITYNMMCGCGFDWSTPNIMVGCSEGKGRAISGLIHEISECIHTEMRQRYTKGRDCNNGDFVFVMNHDQFEQHNNSLVAALKDCGLLARICK